jgi:hypothetical protein
MTVRGPRSGCSPVGVPEPIAIARVCIAVLLVEFQLVVVMAVKIDIYL